MSGSQREYRGYGTKRPGQLPGVIPEHPQYNKPRKIFSVCFLYSPLPGIFRAHPWLCAQRSCHKAVGYNQGHPCTRHVLPTVLLLWTQENLSTKYK